MEQDEYRVINIAGKHGIINLIIPNKEPTQEEWEELHKVIAEVLINAEKEKMKNQATS